ncbi:hypothetical protein IFM89_019027 [Coptis chinensis]|uniref:Uncharacterized protein n=1 Tax=Coptis chinensis TaxID=261450 RepID=A0A835HBV0_9MAGN|nr:hypothetical protein IFM89_019027 [Coptis chinensis]
MNDDQPLEKIAISGPTLASIIQRFSSSEGDVDGLLFGHVTEPSSSNLHDDDHDSTQSNNSPSLVANITNFFCSNSLSSFYDSLGRLNNSILTHLLQDRQQQLIGWFVGRRKSPLRPSMREFSVSSSLFTLTTQPCVFLLLSSPVHDQLIHTHDYKAFQFMQKNGLFESKSIEVVNIGPAFRGHYGSFSPNSEFPWLAPSSGMEEDKGKRDRRVEGFEVGRLSKLMGSTASNYTSELEDLYSDMLGKLGDLARVVEKSSALVLEQGTFKLMKCKETSTRTDTML